MEAVPKIPFQNIVFDLGNVLNKCDLEYAIARLASSSLLNAKDIRKWLMESDVIDRFDAGGLSEEGFNQTVSTILGWNGSIDELREIWEQMLSPDMEMVELMLQLRREGFYVYILSNINPMHARLLDRSLHFIRDAHGYIFSCECGLIKPDPRIFEHLLAKFNLNPDQTIFIDDRKVNTEIASTFGITSILHESPAKTRSLLVNLLLDATFSPLPLGRFWGRTESPPHSRERLCY